MRKTNKSDSGPVSEPAFIPAPVTGHNLIVDDSAQPAEPTEPKAPASPDAGVILRYVGHGSTGEPYFTVGGLPARDLTAADFVATHWTVEDVLKVTPPVYERVDVTEPNSMGL